MTLDIPSNSMILSFCDNPISMLHTEELKKQLLHLTLKNMPKAATAGSSSTHLVMFRKQHEQCNIVMLQIFPRQ